MPRTVELEVYVHAETPSAIYVSDTGDEDEAVWLPKSEVEVESEDNGVVVLQVSEWLAIDRGLA